MTFDDMKHFGAALLLTLTLLGGCGTTEREPQPLAQETPAQETVEPESAPAQETVAPEAVVPEAVVPEPAQIPIVSTPEDFLERLRSEGKSEAEIDAAMERYLTGLREMDRSAGSDRIGSEAPPFQFDAWLNSEPLTLDDLRGNVVLVRWWTETCPYCASSAPALRALHEEYATQGLTVLGVFHPKAGRDDPLDVARVERAVESRQFRFPVAVDWDWRNRTLREWWLTGPDRPATSVTFLVDKAGVIRFVHPGMEYHDADGREGHGVCADDMTSIRSAIEELLAE